jgi:hypothetical protein
MRLRAEHSEGPTVLFGNSSRGNPFRIGGVVAEELSRKGTVFVRRKSVFYDP